MGQDVRFGPFRLDPANERLWRGAEEIVLRPKTFAVLSHLVSHTGDLVHRDDLLEAVWPGVVVSEAVLTVCIGEIRHALGDDAQAPRYIDTVHRRGYRFVGTVTPTRRRGDEPRGVPASIVGRETELGELERHLERARQGVRGVVFVTGDAGIGKSSLVDTFLKRVAATGDVPCARGQCIAQYGAGEAYLPVFDALGRLSRESGSELLKECLSRYAPTWLMQTPALVSTADELEALQRRSAGTGPKRMLRELAEALEALTADRPLILVLEDLHWSDYATVDLVSWLAQRQEPARLLVLGTYRPVEVIVREHPLGGVKQELVRHGRCAELPLELLTADEVERHLATRFGMPASPSSPLHELARTIHRRTDGHPLFLVTLVESLVRQGWLVEREGRWEARAGIEAVAHEVPRSLQELVEEQFQQLGAEDQRLLEAASVVGLEGSTAAVAAGLAAEAMETEERCAALARRGQFLQAIRAEEWPDGTVSSRYRFRHTLHRQVVYDRLAGGRRAQLHARIGARQEAGLREQAAEHAAELATHFEEGRTYERALQYRRRAADNAIRRHAYQEAIDHLRRGINLLPRLPEALERAQEELALCLALGQALSAVHGPAASGVREAYTRAQALCAQVGAPSAHLAVLQGLRRYHLGRAEVGRARELGEEVLKAAERLSDPVQLRRAHAALGTCLLYLGELPAARTHLVQGFAEGEPERPWPSVLTELEADALCRTSAGLALWLLGYPEQAVAQMEKALVLTRKLGVPLVHVSVLSTAAVLHQFLRDPELTQERAEAAMKLATDGGFSLWLAHATILRGWALSMRGQAAVGIAEILRGLEAWRTNEHRLGKPYLLALLAEAHGRAGQTEAGLAVVAEALATVEALSLRMYESELYRLKGELLAMAATAPPREPETSFRQAIAVARRQGSKSLELRAALSLSRHWRGKGRKDAARRLLSETSGWFTEGFDTADLREARAVL